MNDKLKYVEECEVEIDENGRRIMGGLYGGLPNEGEYVALLCEEVLWDNGLTPFEKEKYFKFKENGDYEMVYKIAKQAFELGRSYAEMLEKNDKTKKEKYIPVTVEEYFSAKHVVDNPERFSEEILTDAKSRMVQYEYNQKIFNNTTK